MRNLLLRGLLTLLCVVLFVALAVGGFYFDYWWRKFIVRQAIEESRAAEKP